ncbi:hypothetical protein SLA2020_028780 [Shorea laevis]
MLYVLFDPDYTSRLMWQFKLVDEITGHEVILKLLPNSTPIRGPAHSAASSQVSIDFCNVSSFVNFSGELLRVQKLFNVSELYDHYHGTRFFGFDSRMFLLSKFQLTSDDTMTCTKLGSLGDQALLIAKSTTACILAENLNGVEKNCIHFLEDFEFSNPSTGIPILSCPCGVFQRDNERIYGCLLVIQLQDIVFRDGFYERT